MKLHQLKKFLKERKKKLKKKYLKMIEERIKTKPTY